MASQRPRHGFWRVVRLFFHMLRRLFRWCRIAIWLIILAVLLCGIWLNRVGLPQFLKQKLIAELHTRGIDLEFTRMRLHWYRGLIAENVRLVQRVDTNAPQFSASEAELLVSGRALLHRKVQLSGLALRGGRMALPVWGTNATPRELVVEKVSGELRFSPPDEWELVGFRAQTFGVQFLLAGAVTNASSLRDLKLARTAPPKDKSAAAFWYDLMAKVEQAQIDPRSEIIGSIHGDARDPASFQVSANINSPRVDSYWGQGTNVSVSVQLAPSPSGRFVADISVRAQEAIMPWGRAGSLNFKAHVAPSFTRWTPTNAHLNLSVKQARTAWGNARSLNLDADFSPNPADDSSSLGHYILRAQQVETKWAKSARIELTSDAVLNSSNLWPSSATATFGFNGGDVAGSRASAGTVRGTLNLPPLEQMEFSNTNLSWWTRVDRVSADLAMRLSDVQSQWLVAKELSLNSDWKAPALSLRNMHATLYGGELDGSATLDAQTRVLAVSAKTTADPQQVRSLLDTNTQKFLAQFTWREPPLINASAQITLPSWTNGPAAWNQTDWDKEVMPTFSVTGDFQAGHCTFRALPLSSVQSSFTFTNFTWRLPDLLATRPEGRIIVAHAGHSRTHEFTFDIDSTFNPSALKVLLERSEREALEMFTFTNMPHARIRLAGQSRQPEKISFEANVAATNLSFRGLPVKETRTVITLTNQMLTFVHPVVIRSEGTGRADSVRLDLMKQTIFINHGTGRLNPGDVTHAIGTEVEETMKPYHFGQPPNARAHGLIDLKDVRGTDLHFDLAGGPFQWEWFRFQQITGHVHWIGNAVTLSNVLGSLNGGRLEGSARFDFPEKAPSRFSFRTVFNDINLHSLLSDLGNPTNKVQGTLNGVLVITNSLTEDLKSWNGSGNLAVNDGYLWDFPALGIFSPILNTVKEGLGNSRAKEAVTTFIITNSVIQTSDLLIHASAMRLKFEGTVDFDSRINGRVSAQFFRDMPVVGGLLSTMLWSATKIFEYKVTGTLSHPSATPRYFHPFQTLRNLGGNLLPGEPKPPPPK